MAIGLPAVKLLWTRAHDYCAFPSCSQRLTEESVEAATGNGYVTIVGEQAHIRSARPDGPRYDPEYDSAKLDTYENLILLCPTHHTMVDANNGAGYAVDDLIDMRRKHENRQSRREQIDKTLRAYVGQQYNKDDKVLFEQVDLNGPRVDSMFVDVPFSCRTDVAIADILQQIAESHPPDTDALESADDQVVTGAAQALLHPEWQGNALLVGGPGQGKSTLLQYVCQFHRARMLEKSDYNGKAQELGELTEVVRLPIRLDLREYARWAISHIDSGTTNSDRGSRKSRKRGNDQPRWPLLEEFIAAEVRRITHREFVPTDVSVLISTLPVLIALDGLDEVANIKHREQVSTEIVDFEGRVSTDSANLMILVATRPGATTSALWSSAAFPKFNLRRLSRGLRLLYLRRWASVAALSDEAREKLERTFTENENVPHVRELASYPMQLAILLHLLHRRGLLPQRRTELYGEYLKTFLDREQTEDKEPLLAEQRDVIESCHAYLGWYIQTRAEQGRGAGSIRRSELQKVLRFHLAGNENGLKLADQIFTAFTSRVLCLVEREKDWFQFDVQSLREYFAATYIFEEGKRDARDEYFTAMLRRPYWSNVCRFYVGKYSPAEVRDIRHVLRELSKETPDLGLHPMLRSTLALFLSDRTYERQKDVVTQEAVDFILDGPGVVLAEDGLLDVSTGSALFLSQGAGRGQVVQHVKRRLATELDENVRTALLGCLRRHAEFQDNLAEWWWTECDGSWPWFRAASALGIFARMSPRQESTLAEFVLKHASPDTWMTALLVAGGYGGSNNHILRVVQAEVNEGAAEVVRGASRSTPIGRLLHGAAVALLRSSGASDHSGTTRTRLRRNSESTVLAPVVAATAKLGVRPDPQVDSYGWQERLTEIATVWGEGWILHQAVASLPANVDIEALAAILSAKQPALASRLDFEAAARDHRGDSTWWRIQLASSTSDASRREWLFSALTSAKTPVVIDLADELSGVADRLEPKHYGALREALRSFRKLGIGHQLVLSDALRLNRVAFSARALWLVRLVSTESSVEQIDKRLAPAFAELLAAGLGDLRELTRAVGGGKKIPFDTFRGHRAELPTGGWASSINVGAMRVRASEEVLANPAEWPSDLVQRAVEHVEKRMLSGLQSIGEVAVVDSWFESH